MRNWLLATALAGNVAVWGVAYIGFTRDDPATADSARSQPLHLQVFTFLAPTHTYSGRILQRTPLTITLELTDPTRSRHVCHMAPRIRDAMLQHMFRRPLIVGPDRKKDIKAAHPYLLSAANRALGSQLVSNVVIEEGAAQSAASSRARFARMTDCQAVDATTPEERTAGQSGSRKQNGRARQQERRPIEVPFGRLSR